MGLQGGGGKDEGQGRALSWVCLHVVKLAIWSHQYNSVF